MTPIQPCFHLAFSVPVLAVALTEYVLLSAGHLLWLTVGAFIWGWAQYCAKTGRSPLPDVPSIFTKKKPADEEKRPPRPSVGV